ncbi:MAG: hypothetical protein IPJ65_04250 [Archangiaceae bacterium]|nr:hypothetical protein [Archangiaceae bacterium]
MGSRLEMAAAHMNAFADRTGVSSTRPAHRYLWTDAFAVCNLLGLAEATEEPRYLELAMRLVDQVHHVLGRHRPDDARRGWLSGLGDREGERHPTRGGLRIGKPRPERLADQALDDSLEWERDGQYFHYLTRWMHALDQLARFTGEPRFGTWAGELADAACAAFVDPGGEHMVWKMSIDLTRPLVASMGQHDPLDGLITLSQLRATAAELGGGVGAPPGAEAASHFGAMIQGREWATNDALGLGGLLVDALRAEQVLPGSRLPETLLDAARVGLKALVDDGELELPPSRRLAFRELGLAVGLRAVERLARARGRSGHDALKALVAHVPVADAIEATWCEPRSQDTSAWHEHRDINEVMLATALAPDGYLVRAPLPQPPSRLRRT